MRYDICIYVVRRQRVKYNLKIIRIATKLSSITVRYKQFCRRLETNNVGKPSL